MKNTSAVECLACGACCFGKHDRYIALFPEDLTRGLPENALNRIDGRTYMRMENGHCAQLTLTESGALACAVYEARPTACRAFRAGSFECGRSRAHRLVEADAMRQREPVPVRLPPVQVPAAEIAVTGLRRGGLSDPGAAH
ncbi:YkgJ family cysteine cluster protein [Oceanicola sp. 22II-s10i]|uniref:YkgJ family cysteine cluster protein n=1 Tax=Oceanicola sp. 22II-s10i TaxID=1317116 RepID=UPI001594EF6F|nr:YkgJ family cysteine cluster protein [Oceanicola sp. 22II-s10i]